ncbi:4469_t:CDS:2 [Ambispora leptoticha]|uniref:4469_t:CDS:1 n=1 Tax=Ambispora leptoticha TaxID=144679 RepID=A0A9N9G197_9GLOM|nr:4469_t:CDS:2 [Ambispora leptoticha]
MSDIVSGCKFIFYDNNSKEVFRATSSGCYNVNKISTASFFGNGFSFAGLSTDTTCGNALVFQAAQVADGGFVIGGTEGPSSFVHKTSSFEILRLIVLKPYIIYLR